MLVNVLEVVMTEYRPVCTPDNCLVSSGIVDLDQVSTLSCPAVSKLHATLQNVFGYTEFRPGQLKAAVAALHGHDVFCSNEYWWW